MRNRQIYVTDPEARKLVNEGVASVNDDMSPAALTVLRYELETFVCDGQYEKGLAHILETYLKNIQQAQQPAVWVSGFYGSGKSHLVKMLRALWVDTSFEDGATARGIAALPQEIGDHLKELTTHSQRYDEVREAVEACCKNIGSKLLFVGTGQTAVTGTPNLKKHEGRFTIRIELSDADVDAVIRQVILAKKPDAISPINALMETNLGEISRHLSDTTIGHRQNDIPFFPQDYPILPVRRRFWEHTLRVLDPTGTDSQLRNQLSMVHKAIQTNLDHPMGHVIPADYLYFDSADKLLQSRILPRKVHEKTMIWLNGSEEERLLGRACGLVFLINKLAGSNKDIGIKATVDAIADLMVEDLSKGSGALRGKLPGLLDKAELLIKVGDEYRIQTEESAAWNDEFLSQRSRLASESISHRGGTRGSYSSKIRGTG